MAIPTSEDIRALTRSQLLDRFNEEVVKPARRRVRQDPSNYYVEAQELVEDARDYFWSRASRFPTWRQAICIFAEVRLRALGVPQPLIDKATEITGQSIAEAEAVAQWIVYPKAPWKSPPNLSYLGLLEALQSEFGSPEPSTPPPESEPEFIADTSWYDSQIAELERKISVLEDLLRDEKFRLKDVQDRRKHFIEGERAKHARAEEERKGRERKAKEEAERKARERYRHRTRRHKTAPWWATELGLSPPYTYDSIKAAYRKLSLKYHPDQGGDAAAFIKLDKAYKEALRIYATAGV
jgi:hypothetical protein